MAIAVIYRFEIWERGERRLVTEEGVAGSTLAMLAPQLNSVPHRPLLAQGPGWMIFTHYQAARQAAQTLGETADSIELREVAPAAEEEGGWVAEDGTRYAAVAGGLSQRVR